MASTTPVRFEQLGATAERLLRETWQAQRQAHARRFSISDEAQGAILEGQEDLIAAVRAAITRGEVARALVVYFGNDSDAGFLFLDESIDLIPPSERAACLEHVWTHGQYGEHDFIGAGHISGHRLTRRAVRLFRAIPELQRTVPLKLPAEVAIHRGVVARNSRSARTKAHHPAWTLRRDVAVWFAIRRVPRGYHAYVASALVPREALLAYFDQRGEAEVVVDPRPFGGTMRIEQPTLADLEAADRLKAAKPHRARQSAPPEHATPPRSMGEG